MNRSFWVPGLLLLSACARRETVPSPQDAPSQSAGPTPAITLERTACFGRCPVYTLAIFPSGEVHFEGKANVHQMGAATGKVPREQVDQLLSEIERAGYFSLADRYAAAEPSCGRYATDAPTVITSVRVGNRTKRVVHDYGCGSVPGLLTVLERRIDEAVNSGQWTGR